MTVRADTPTEGGGGTATGVSVARMAEIWVQSLHNLHCPRCDRRLVQQAGRFFVPERRRHVVVGEVGTLACPAGHRLPDREELYAYRAQAGHAPSAPVRPARPPAFG